MERSPLSLASDDVRFCVIGNVTIHPTAAIATNVVLRANPDSSLVIGAGVVVGQGCVLHANGGPLVLDNGVALGTQVLVFGQGRVGEKACIGSFSTLMVDIDIRGGEMVPARTLLDTSSPRLTSPHPKQEVAEASESSIGQSSDNSRGAGVNQSVNQPRSNMPKDDQSASSKNSEEKGTLHGKSNVDSPNHQSPPAKSFGSGESNGHSGSHNMFMPLNTPRYSTGTAHVSPNSLEIPGLDDNHTLSSNGQPSTSSEQHSAHPPATSTSKSPVEQSGQEDRSQDTVEGSQAKHNIEEELSPRSVVYGKSSVQRLMTMMFPYRTLNNSGDEKE